MTHRPNPGYELCHLVWLHQQCAYLELVFCSDEVNPSVRSLYVRMYVRTYTHIFTSLRTGWVNQIRWLQLSQDITVDLAVVIKLGVDYLFRNIGKWSWKIKGVMRKKKNKRSIAPLFLSISLIHSYSISLYICTSEYFNISTLSIYILIFNYLYLISLSLPASIYLYLYLSLSVSLFIFLTRYCEKDK